MEVKPLPRSENCQRRTRNSNSENASSRDENKERIMMMTNKNSNSGCKHKVKSGKSMAPRPLLGFKLHYSSNVSSASSTTVSLTTSCLNATPRSLLRSRSSWCPLVWNALILIILFTNGINFGNCAVNSAANSDSLINQPQQHTTTFDDTTTTTSSSTKFNNNNNNNQNKNSNKLNDTQNLLLPQLANQQKRMNSNGGSGGNESDIPENLLGTSPGSSSLRSRTDSESSDKLQRFVLPSMDGSPPKVMTLNEVADVVKNIQNMELAHEIALNPEFKLQPYEPPENSLEKVIKETMHKVFWDNLRLQLNENPPCYDYAIRLLGDIKECFPQILSPTNKRALEHINEILDESVIRQQAEKGVLDFRNYANFVVQIMAKSCAPARDDAVKELTQIEDVVDTFKGILETMTLMKLDMANFLLDFARNDIMANSVEYEKQKFQEYLEYYKFGFPATENWLKRNRTHDANNVPISGDQTISNAYMELMDWPEDVEFPEILSIDKDRILKLGQKAKRLCVGASLIAICSAVPIISQRTENRIQLAQQIDILLQGVTNEKSISELIDNIWEQIKTVVNQYLQKEDQSTMDAAAESLLKTQIMQIANKDSPVRQLMWKRLQTYFRLALRSKGGLPPPPPGYTDFKTELENFATALKRVIAYNHSVFGEYFLRILTQRQPESTNNEASESATSSGSSSEVKTQSSQ